MPATLWWASSLSPKDKWRDVTYVKPNKGPVTVSGRQGLNAVSDFWERAVGRPACSVKRPELYI